MNLSTTMKRIPSLGFMKAINLVLLIFMPTGAVPAKLAKEFDGKIVIYKVNIDKEQQMARAFGISSIPALLWCPSKGEPAFTQGALPEDALRKRIEEFLLK